MKKLSVFIYSMGGGGAERVVSNLLFELVKKYEVYLILMCDRIYYNIPKEVEIYYIEKSQPFENGIKKLLKLPFLAYKYKKICKKLDINIHFVWMVRPCFIAAISRIFGLKGAMIFNECSTPSVLYQDNSLKSKISKFLLKKLYPKADFIMPNSIGNLNDLNINFGIKKNKMQVLYNAVDFEDIKEKSKAEISFKKPFFLSIGRLDEGKNHELLIKTYAKLKNNNKNLLILGEGILKEYLQNLINELNLQNRVFLLGFDKNPYKYLSKCYAFVFLSRFEGFSNALIEALVCEKCIISSEHKSGARELLGDDEYGILVGVDDENSTLNAMQKILDDESYVKFYEKKAKIRALDFDKKEISKKLIEKIDEIYEKYKIKEINDEI